MLGSGAVFTPAERLKMQSWMDEIYGVFKGHVTKVRGDKLKKPIDDLAGGRVYTGKQALELGLVDRLGTLHDALKFVAEAAKLTDYDVRVVPHPKSAFERLFDQSSGDDDRKGINVDMAAAARPFLITQALPLVQALDPARAAVVLNALGRLELIRREGVVLMAPELSLGW
jgi:protease-4